MNPLYELGNYPNQHSNTINLDFIIKTVLDYCKRFDLLKNDFNRLEQKLDDLFELIEPEVRKVLEEMYNDGRLERIIAKYFGWSATLEMFGGGADKTPLENETAFNEFLSDLDFTDMILRDTYFFENARIRQIRPDKAKTVIGGNGMLVFRGNTTFGGNAITYEYANKYPFMLYDVKMFLENCVLDYHVKCGKMDNCEITCDENSRIEFNPQPSGDFSSDVIINNLLINSLNEGSDTEPLISIKSHDGHYCNIKGYTWRPFMSVSQHNSLFNIHPVWRSARFTGSDIEKIYCVKITANNVYFTNLYCDNFPVGIWVDGTFRWKVDNFTCLWYEGAPHNHYGVYVADNASKFHGMINGGDLQYLYNEGNVTAIRLPEGLYYTDYENNISNFHVESDTMTKLTTRDPIFKRYNIDVVGKKTDSKTFIGCTYHTAKATFNLKVYSTVTGLDLQVRGSTIESAKIMYGVAHSLKVWNYNDGNFTYWFVSPVNDVPWGVDTYLHVLTDCKWWFYNEKNPADAFVVTHYASLETTGKITIDGVEFIGVGSGLDLNISDISNLPVGFTGRIILNQIIDGTSFDNLACGVFVTGKPTRKVFYVLGTNLQYLIIETSSGLTCKRIFN